MLSDRIHNLIIENKIDKESLIEIIKKEKTFRTVKNHFNVRKKDLLIILKYYNINFNHDTYSYEEKLKERNRRVKKISLERYNTDHPAKSKEVRNKILNTVRKKYGVDYYTQTDKFKEKRAKTNKERYGVNSPFAMVDFYDKAQKTWLKKYGVDNPSKSTELINKKYETMNINGTDKRSYKEDEVYNFIKLFYKGEIITNTRKEINEEIDIYIPEFKIGIEYNGNYWHSTDRKRMLDNKLYHYNKSSKAREVGIRLIHIYEWEWSNARIRPILESVLKISLGIYEEKIYAKQCIIKEINNKEYRDFCELNHLQGYRPAEIKLGLFYQDRLVQLMSFGKPIHSKNKYQYEIVRGCPGSNNVVVGGVSKLYKHFIRNYNPESIMSFGDFNKFDGSSYEMLGMTLDRMDKGNRWFVNRKSGKISNWLYRNKEKRDKLIEESFVIYGAGNLVYKWQNPNLEQINKSV